MKIERMKEIKKEKGYTYAQIAEGADIPLSTVQKVFGGSTESPRYDTLEALNRFFGEPAADRICEGAAQYGKQQGEYTLEDYYAIPDDQRVELIDGVICEMKAPTSIHQMLVVEIAVRFRNFIHGKKGSCIPIVSPIDVQLDCDDRTMVQPDVIVMCDRDKVTRKCIFGAPDFVMEILSPSTARKDSIKKLSKYENAGVREYWIVDPDHKRVLVYDFSTECYPIVYGFDAKIPVGIFDGEMEIDMAEIEEYISAWN
ncbi:MAG: Uma2 family endonuclease [Hespellia sp.]|nr:Uma2 family endonuclease [Hespellia sp.]